MRTKLTRKLGAIGHYLFVLYNSDSTQLAPPLKCIFILKVVDHYENPRNVGSLDKKAKNVGTGLVGAPACGDVMKLQVISLA